MSSKKFRNESFPKLGFLNEMSIECQGSSTAISIKNDTSKPTRYRSSQNTKKDYGFCISAFEIQNYQIFFYNSFRISMCCFSACNPKFCIAVTKVKLPVLVLLKLDHLTSMFQNVTYAKTTNIFGLMSTCRASVCCVMKWTCHVYPPMVSHLNYIHSTSLLSGKLCNMLWRVVC